jgi:outer membrane receptor for ferrienterochelin and colicins
MKYIRYLGFIIILFSAAFSYGQKGGITGIVVEISELTNNKKQPVPGVNIYWAGTTDGTSTNGKGEFYQKAPDKLPAKLVFSYVGFPNDTLLVEKVPLFGVQVTFEETISLNEFEVVAREKTTKISIIQPINVEIITNKELKKAACCNLSESFETNASIDVNFSDAVSGTKTVQMLGLDGIYSQIMTENIPYLRGLSAKQGLTFVPGTWIESIQITKGSGSVVNGYESITGQLNLEFLKPDEKKLERLYLNLYGNHNGRYEGNAHWKSIINDKWSTMSLIHAMGLQTKNDHNDDGFLDMPLMNHLTAMHRWRYKTKNVEGHFGGSYHIMDKTGGQLSFNPADDIGSTNAYGVGINIEEIDITAKNGFLFPNRDFGTLGLIAEAKRYKQESYYGQRSYNAVQDHLYFNSIYESIIGNTFHKFKAGVSYLYDDYSESFNDSTFNRIESVPGGYFEYTYSNDGKTSVVAGIRGDVHNLYGFMVNPRLHLRHNPLENVSFRGSIGKGFRTPNVIADNATVLASSRAVIVQGDLSPEEAWNYGGSITWKFEMFGRETVLRGDFYRTEFINQVIVDLDQDAGQVLFYNLDGQSYSNSFQTDFEMEPAKRLSVRLAYKFTDVKATYGGSLLERPLVPRQRALFNIGYETENEKWKFDFTYNWFGASRLPNTSGNPTEYQLDDYSLNYSLMNTQVTKAFKYFEWYVGAENLANFKQNNAIIAADDPFGGFFDASLIWGPLNGRVIYSGLRFKIQ